tara:strand:- start:467 stop:1714 length:1248 start_codon:yes stop_codon:yes gene_type:complete
MNIAIVGGGISGISAGWELAKHHNVTIFESNSKIGGHSNTFEYTDQSGNIWPIDTGFIVFNDWNYPLFKNFIHQLNIPEEETDMSFSFTDEKNNISYSGTLSGLFPNKKSALNPSQILFLFNIYKYSKKLNSSKVDDSKNIIQVLKELGCPNKVIENYFIPISSAIWSCDPDYVRYMPASTFINFFNNHKLFEFFNKPKWKTIPGGSKKYVDKFTNLFKGSIQVNSEVISVEEVEDFVQITLSNNSIQAYDYVVMATHSDISNRLIKNLSSSKKEILQEYQYTENNVVLHTDETYMPLNKRTWSSWNVMNTSTDNSKNYHVTYYMNRLQNISSETNFFVTLNPSKLPDPSTLIFQTSYSHPILSHSSSENEKSIYKLNKSGKIKFCGAYLGYGFHEDGFKSGKMVAQNIISDSGL